MRLDYLSSEIFAHKLNHICNNAESLSTVTVTIFQHWIKILDAVCDIKMRQYLETY